jgi:membrane associated rhomboid family serine protease
MIPLRDDNPPQRVPVVTRTLIVANVVVFLFELTRGEDLPEFLRNWGLVPGNLFAALSDVTTLPREFGTVFTSLFLHAGWLHLIGNMWYLWIFGDNVEDSMGPWRFLGFYLSAGFVAALLHSSVMPGSPIPTVGASGAIAGVLGAYALRYPRARVMTLIPIFFFFQVVAVPALVVLGIWFVFQFIAGTMALGSGSGGVAWWAHIAGFAYGFIFMGVLTRRQRERAEIVQ